MSDIQPISLPDSRNSPDKDIPPRPGYQRSPSLQILRSWAPLYLKKTDRTLDRLHKILSTPSGTDTVLLTICYSSLLASTVLSSISLHRLHRAATQLVQKIIALPPNTTVVIDTSSIPASKLLIAAKRLRALSELISDFRIFARLWGLLGIWKWGQHAIQDPHEDVLVRRLVYSQVAVNFVFQYLENGAYLSSKGVLGWSAAGQNKAWIWSSRAWATHVGLDLIRLYREWALRQRRGTEEERRTDGPKGDVITERGQQEWRTKWLRDVLVNAAWAPLTLHWSFEKGLLGDFGIGLLGSFAGVAGLTARWSALET